MSETREKEADVGYLWVLVALTALFFAIRAPFTASFWLDETITAWIVSGSLASAWTRAIDFQGQSPLYYSLVWVVRQLFGGGELVLRALSIGCGALVLFVAARIARKLSTGWTVPLVVVALLIGSDGFQDAVLSARPYALAMLCASTSLLLLLSLREGYSVGKVAAFSASLVATFYAHYLFAVVGLVHLLVLVGDRQLMRRLLPWGVVTALACVPGVFQLVSLSRRAAALSFGAMPVISIDSLWQLPAALLAWSLGVLKITVPVIAVVSCGVGVILAVIWDGRVRLGVAVRANLVLLMSYVLIPPLLFLIVSCLSPSMLLVPRYWSWSLVPLAVLLALIVGSVQGQRARKIAVLTTLVFLILRVLSQERALEEWRGAAALARASATRVVLFSGLIEAEGPSQIEVGEYYQYLRAPLLVYGVEQPIDVVGVTYSEEQLKSAFEVAPFTLVAFHARRSGVLSPERFVHTIERQGREPSLQEQGRLITVANVR
jgi:hypothetical protein